MIVYRVREMIGGNAVRFENNDILIVFRHGDIALYRIVEYGFFFRVPLRP